MSSSEGWVAGEEAAVITCRHRINEVLSFVDQEGPVVGAAIHRLVEESACLQGHPVHFAALVPFLAADESGHFVLSDVGTQWLLDDGRPRSAWSEHVPPGLHALREWQKEALDAWAAHGRHGVVQAVTGTGKSRVGIEAVREALRHDFSALIVVPTVDLVEQWAKSLRSHGVTDFGVAAEGSRPTFLHHDVIVGTVQSLYNAPPTRVDGKVLLVADECHRYGAGQWRRVLDASYRRRLGLTATFERNDEGIEALRKYFGGPHVYEIGFGRAIAEDVIAPYRLDLVPVRLTAQERRRYDEVHDAVCDARVKLVAAGLPEDPFGEFLHAVEVAASDEEPDWELRDLARRYLSNFSERLSVLTNARAKIDATRVLAPVVRRSRGALVFTRRVETAEELAEVLREEGVAAEALHSRVPKAERGNRLAHLRAGKLRAIVAPTVLDEGVDVPDVDLGIVVGGSKSRRQMTQRMGRVLRRKSDGRAARFLVVYAQDTVEDLSQASGAEGCLDLLWEHAQTRRTLTAEEAACDQPSIPEVAAAAPHHSEQAEGAAVSLEAPAMETDIDPPPRSAGGQRIVEHHSGRALVDALAKLAALRRDGLLTDEEFAVAKARVLGLACGTS